MAQRIIKGAAVNLSSASIFLIVEAVDMRLGIEGLSQLIAQTLGYSPCDGTAYAFSNSRRNRLKLLIWDGTGVWLCQRRLHRGHFIWPNHGGSPFQMDEGSWRWLTQGVDWQRLNAAPDASK